MAWLDIVRFFDRFGTILGLCVTTFVCCTLFILQIQNYRGSEKLLNSLQAYQSGVAILVQVVSQLLGLIQVQAACTLARSSFLLSLKTRSYRIRHIQFAKAATTPEVAWTLSFGSVLILSLIASCSIVPAALWAGALAPLPSERNVTKLLAFPTFDIANISQLWEFNDTARIAGKAWLSNKGGLFSDDAAVSKGIMTSSASDASMLSGGFHKHVKLDKTGYSYLQRSYGTGSVAGFDDFANTTDINWFSYVEKGFYSDVSCYYNSSSLWSIRPFQRQTGSLSTYSTVGRLANGDRAMSVVYMAYMDNDIYGWNSFYQNTSRTLSVEMSTLANNTNDSWGFSGLNNIRCDVKPTLREFSVLVNTTSKLITSTPLSQASEPWPKYGDAVSQRVSEWVWALGFLDGACAGGCPLGKSLVANYQLLQNLTQSNSNQTILTATENYMAALTDNILVNLKLLRLVGQAKQATEETWATVGVPAVVFGDFKIIVFVSVINMAILVTYIVLLIWTRAWSGAPAVDVSNICDIFLLAWRGSVYYSENCSEGMAQKERPLSDDTRMVLQYVNRGRSNVPVLVPMRDDTNILDDLQLSSHNVENSLSEDDLVGKSEDMI